MTVTRKSTTTRNSATRQARPIGPGSLLWRYAGDSRLGFVGLSTGILQLMHPGVGAGVAQHSDFFDDPWHRIERSVPEILGVVYDPEPEVTGRRVRDYHRRIKGIDHLGRPYRALAPDTFWWAHATFQWAVEQLVDRFDSHRLSDLEREELYQDGVEWYRRYGVSMRPVPAEHSGFVAEWQRHCLSVLELTPAAERAVDLALRAPKSGLPELPWWTAPLQRSLVTPVLHLTAIGGLPSAVRRRFGIPWRLDEEVQYRALQRLVRDSWRLVPPLRRHHPRATAGHRAALARPGASGAVA